ncbi:MAG: hypothetical protein LBU65_13375, partial [Planctomycetaceae bacterium]|nr:hypothetical protein [Planctomycetaceae bacterium]
QQEFKMNAFKRYPSELNNSYISETALRQYAIDAQRLARFDGASDEEIRTMKITFGKSNGENKTYFTLKNVV